MSGGKTTFFSAIPFLKFIFGKRIMGLGAHSQKNKGDDQCEYVSCRYVLDRRNCRRRLGSYHDFQ
jgi:hypothetical protein